jgi:hypothetical protein
MVKATRQQVNQVTRELDFHNFLITNCLDANLISKPGSSPVIQDASISQ